MSRPNSLPGSRGPHLRCAGLRRMAAGLRIARPDLFNRSHQRARMRLTINAETKTPSAIPSRPPSLVPEGWFLGLGPGFEGSSTSVFCLHLQLSHTWDKCPAPHPCGTNVRGEYALAPLPAADATGAPIAKRHPSYPELGNLRRRPTQCTVIRRASRFGGLASFSAFPGRCMADAE